MIKDNIIKVRERIAFACSRGGRDPGEITLVAVSKNRAVVQIEEAIAAGITDIGESRVQEAVQKVSSLKFQVVGCKLHMIGHLQTNKVKDCVKVFDLIHSVDSLHLAEEIDKQAAKINKIQDILLEVKTSPEATKSGIEPGQALELVKEISALKNVSLQGLMTIAPLLDDLEKARPYFRRVKELKDEINSLKLATCNLQLLSMGMSDDFEIAIEEGATTVRLGRAIFGD